MSKQYTFIVLLSLLLILASSLFLSLPPHLSLSLCLSLSQYVQDGATVLVVFTGVELPVPDSFSPQWLLHIHRWESSLPYEIHSHMVVRQVLGLPSKPVCQAHTGHFIYPELRVSTHFSSTQKLKDIVHSVFLIIMCMIGLTKLKIKFDNVCVFLP